MKLRIEKEEYMNKTFRLNVKLVKQMEEITDRKGISLNKFVDLCIRYSLENLDTDEPKEATESTELIETHKNNKSKKPETPKARKEK